VKSNLGVPDHVMFNYAIKELEDISHTNKPFFATLLTASNHEPFVFPDEIKLNYQYTSENDRIKEYTDFAVANFIKSAKQTAWGKNTIFVITSDHGKAIDNDYEVSLAYHHIPLFVYAPALFKQNDKFKNFGSQVDIMPTIFGLLGKATKRENVGKNLFSYQKPFSVSVADDKVMVVDSMNLLIFGKQFNDKYYDLRTKKAISLNSKAKVMKRYAVQFLQASRVD
jgi:phosphoglycerol transferase MdoB-like AlkP superfamily enzyme